MDDSDFYILFFYDMELKWTLNLLHWSMDEKNGIFALEFEDSKSQKTISIKISREEMAEIFFGWVHRWKENCKISIPENIGKQIVKETHRVKMEWYRLEEDEVKKYFEEKWMNYDEWERYEQRAQSSMRYWKDWEPNEREIMIVKYV